MSAVTPRSFCAAVSTILAISCCAPYARSILVGRTRPHQYSWLVFTLTSGIVALSQYLAGARASALVAVTFFAGSTLNFLLSLRHGERNTSPLDRVLLATCLATIAAWMLTGSNGLAIGLSVLIDLCAYVMIGLKVRAQPRSEASWPWILAASAYAFACLSVVGSEPLLWVRPVYGLLSDAALVVLILRWSRPADDRRGLRLRSPQARTTTN